MKAMERPKGPRLLHSYAPVNVANILRYLEGKTIMGDAGKEIFFVKNGTKCTFGSYDLFLNCGFNDRATKHVRDEIMAKIPSGRVLETFDCRKEPDGSNPFLIPDQLTAQNHTLTMDMVKIIMDTANMAARERTNIAKIEDTQPHTKCWGYGP